MGSAIFCYGEEQRVLSLCSRLVILGSFFYFSWESADFFEGVIGLELLVSSFCALTCFFKHTSCC